MFKFNEKLGEQRGPAGGDSEGRILKPYVPIEEVPDSSNIEKFEEKNLSIQPEYEITPSSYSKEEEENIERLHDELMSQTINFQRDDGVAHVGPEFNGLEDVEELIDDTKNISPNQQFTSSHENFRENIYQDSNDQRYKKRIPNLKNMNPRKKERMGRKDIKEFYDRQDVPERPSLEDFLDEHKNNNI